MPKYKLLNQFKQGPVMHYPGEVLELDEALVKRIDGDRPQYFELVVEAPPPPPPEEVAPATHVEPTTFHPIKPAKSGRGSK